MTFQYLQDEFKGINIQHWEDQGLKLSELPPLFLKVTPELDSKIGSYGLSYYVTFIHKEAFNALKEWLKVRTNAIGKLLPEGPVLILLDELVVYTASLSGRGQGTFLAVLNKLVAIISKRPQSVLVITDPGQQMAYARESAQLADNLESAAKKLDDVLGRKAATGFDPIGGEAARIISRRLFESVDPTAAQTASATYHSLYNRVHSELAGTVPANAASASYAKEIVAVRVRRGDTILGVLRPGAHAPSLSAGPGAFSADEALARVNWSAADPDGDDVHYLVRASTDGGAAWQVIGVNLGAPHIELRAEDFGGREVLLQVFASDGLHTSSMMLGPFAVPAGGEPLNH